MSALLRPVALPRASLEDESMVGGQGHMLAPLLALGRDVARELGLRRVWMVSSTATGGGVAEMMPTTCGLLRALGVDVRWLVLEPNDASFFAVTKALHHLLHGRDPGGGSWAAASAEERFIAVSREAALSLAAFVEPGDTVVIHDPQPSALVALLPASERVRALWRCHVGVPKRNEHTEAAWRFLSRWLEPYEALLFSSDRYIPERYRSRSAVMLPTINPLSHKNRELPVYKLLGILRCAGLLEGKPAPWAEFAATAQRYVGGGQFHAAPVPSLTFGPSILHVSRFDPLKGFALSIEAFHLLLDEGKARAARLRAASDRSLHELSRCQLLLAGPDPGGVADDPEAAAVLADLCAKRDSLPSDVASRVHLLKLPMTSVKENALMVNALQRMANVIIQPSIEEGFGLTVTEAMYKAVPLVATDVGGIAQQVRSGVDGLLVPPGDPSALAQGMLQQLIMVKPAERMARSAQRRVAERFLCMSEVRQWLEWLRPSGSAPTGE